MFAEEKMSEDNNKREEQLNELEGYTATRRRLF